MTQFTTERYHQYSLPGATVTLGKTESIFSRKVAQQLTITIGGAPDPLIAEELFEIDFVMWGMPIHVEYEGQIGDTLAVVAAGLAAAWNANGQAASLYSATSALAVITLVAKSSNISLPISLFVGTTTPATHTITFAQSVAAGGTALRMGIFYVFDTTAPIGPAISSTGRRAWAVRAPVLADEITDIRGIVAREVNSTTLDPSFDETLFFDQYPAGTPPGYGQLTEEVVAVVDPNSAGIMDVGSEVHVVRNAGAFTTPGAVASAADGANTLRLDNVNPQRAVVKRREETLTMGSGVGAQSVRLVTLEVWRAI
jgi:hypothetical protein